MSRSVVRRAAKPVPCMVCFMANVTTILSDNGRLVIASASFCSENCLQAGAVMWLRTQFKNRKV